MKTKYLYLLIFIAIFDLFSLTYAMDQPENGYKEQAVTLSKRLGIAQDRLPRLIEHATQQPYWLSLLKQGSLENIQEEDYKTSCIHNLEAIITMCFSNRECIFIVRDLLRLAPNTELEAYNIKTTFDIDEDFFNLPVDSGDFDSQLEKKFNEYPYNKPMIDALRERLEKDKDLPKGKSRVYFIAIIHWDGKSEVTATDHAFALERFVDSDGLLSTRIYQSWLHKSTLLKDITNRKLLENKALNESQFSEFMENFEKLYLPKIALSNANEIFFYVNKNDSLPRYTYELRDGMRYIFGFQLKFSSTVVDHEAFVENFAKFIFEEGISKRL